MLYVLTLIGALLSFILIVFLRYLWIRLGIKDRNYTQVQRVLRLEPRPEASEGFLTGSKLSQSTPQNTEPKPVRKIKTYRPFQSITDIKRSYIIDAILDKPRWRQEWEDREW